MFTLLKLTNFQNHLSQTFKLEPITVFTGRNGAGKSALMRAFKWLALNDWDDRKDTFIAWGQEFAEVKAKVGEHKVVRRKGKGENIYELDGTTMLAGTSVPDPLRQVLQIEADHFQDQDEPPYWLALTAGQAAVALNEIFNLGVIDTSLSAIGSKVREAKTKVKHTRERLSTAKTDKATLAWTVTADEDLVNLEDIANKLVVLHGKLTGLQGLLYHMEEIDMLQRTAQDRIASGMAAVAAGQRLLNIDRELTKLKRILELEDELCRLAKTLKVKSEQLNELLEICPLCGRSP